MEKFPLPYVLTNCHNSLCAVGGTINEDDHQFALSAAHKYGGIYVPPCMAVIHSYNREMMAGCGRMILGSDSHTRYGALGTMAVGEGGGELAKQLVGRTYDMAYPGVVAVYLTGSLQPGVGPHDVALGAGGRDLCERLCQEQGHGVRGPRRGEPFGRLPQRHRLHDDRDDLLVEHLADRRRHRGITSPSMAARATTARWHRPPWPITTAASSLTFPRSSA